MIFHPIFFANLQIYLNMSNINYYYVVSSFKLCLFEAIIISELSDKLPREISRSVSVRQGLL